MTDHSPGTSSYPEPQPWVQAYAPIYPPQPARHDRRWLTYGLTAFVSLLLGIVIGSSGETETSAASPRPTVTVTEMADTVAETAPEQTESGPLTTAPGDGQYLVGEDIKPGTYKTAGTDGFTCYWARLKDASGEFGAIIANGNVSGQTRVTLKKGEYFETKGCQDWKRVG
ncbi:hypothetical protein [Nonomuraea sp. NPDC048826]|uniref:hypothetical protein n=1 Tax=Nonomuraea sp. NPDC048826 TaxID=3364347 RepID=UPI003714781B